jgi:hypothetical protein
MDGRFEAVRQHLSDLADDRLGCTAFLERLRPTSPAVRETRSPLPPPPPLAPPSAEGKEEPHTAPPLFPRPTDAAVSSAYVDVDEDIRGKWPAMRTGTTATCVILSPAATPRNNSTTTVAAAAAAPRLWDATIAWSGDSGAIAIMPSLPPPPPLPGQQRGKQPQQQPPQQQQPQQHRPRLSAKHLRLTRDHHVTSAEERLRIMNASSNERRMNPSKSFTHIQKRVSGNGHAVGPEAVMNAESGVSLMVTRSLGDGCKLASWKNNWQVPKL